MRDMANSEKRTLYRETTERFWVLQLVTEVREGGIYIRLKPLQRSFRRIRPGDVRHVSVTSYEATTYAGWHWGIHQSPSGNTVYRLRGDQGVEIELENGEHWFIGSQRPEALVSEIANIRETK